MRLRKSTLKIKLTISNKSKATWKLVNSFLGRSSKSSVIKKIKSDNSDEVITDSKLIADKFGAFFSSAPTLLVRAKIGNNKHYLPCTTSKSINN